MREQPQDDPQEPGCCCCWNLPLSHSPWDLPGSSCSRCSPNMWNIRAPELLGRQSGFHGDFPPLKSVWGLFISGRCFCYNKSACFTCPEIFPWEISLLALCSPACLGFYLALLAIVLFIRETDFLFFKKIKILYFYLPFSWMLKVRVLLVVHLSFGMETAPATLAVIILNDICWVHGEIFQLMFPWKAGNDAEGNTSTGVPESHLCSFHHQLSLFVCSMLMPVKTQKVLKYIEFLCVIARGEKKKYIEVNVCLGKYIFCLI